jgi:peptidylprolyl isomerase
MSFNSTVNLHLLRALVCSYLLLFPCMSSAQLASPLRIDVVLSTTQGDIGIHLYDDTPQHKANFLKLVNEGYYDGLQFHRIIKEFMIQGGDPNSRDLKYAGPLGAGDVGYMLEAEIRPARYHKRGALAAARTGDDVNPERRSSGCQFYIVQGKTYRATELEALEQQQQGQQFQAYMRTYLSRPEHRWIVETINQLRGPAMQHLQQADPDSFARVNAKLQQAEAELQQAFAREVAVVRYTPEQRQTYVSEGGTPFLDGGYTVFGEVVFGLDVVEAIAALPTDATDRPSTPVVMRAVPEPSAASPK